MDGIVIFRASYKDKSFAYNEDFPKLSDEIDSAIAKIVLDAAHTAAAIAEIVFYEDQITLEIRAEEGDFNFDEIEARFISNEILSEYEEFFETLHKMYIVAFEEGEEYAFGC